MYPAVIIDCATSLKTSLVAEKSDVISQRVSFAKARSDAGLAAGGQLLP